MSVRTGDEPFLCTCLNPEKKSSCPAGAAVVYILNALCMWAVTPLRQGAAATGLAWQPCMLWCAKDRVSRCFLAFVTAQKWSIFLRTSIRQEVVYLILYMRCMANICAYTYWVVTVRTDQRLAELMTTGKLR